MHHFAKVRNKSRPERTAVAHRAAALGGSSGSSGSSDCGIIAGAHTAGAAPRGAPRAAEAPERRRGARPPLIQCGRRRRYGHLFLVQFLRANRVVPLALHFAARHLERVPRLRLARVRRVELRCERRALRPKHE